LGGAGGAAGAMVSPVSGLNDIVTSTKDSIAGMKDQVNGAKDAISKALEPVRTITTYFQVFFDLLGRGDTDAALNVLVLGVQRFTGLDISSLVTLGKDVLPKIGTAIGDLVTWLKSLWPDPLQGIITGMKDLATNALAAGKDAIPKITKAVSEGIDVLKDWRKILDENSLVLSIIVGVATSVATAWAIMTALAVAHSAVMAVQTAITWGLVVAQTALAAPLLLIISILAGIVAGLIWAYNTSDDFKRIVDAAFVVIQAAAKATGDAFGALGKIIGDTWDTAVNDIKIAVNAIIGFINTLIKAWNGIELSIPGFDVGLPGGGSVGWGGVRVSTPDLGMIPTLSNGGIATRPTLAVVGDVPEAIVPLSQLENRGGVDLSGPLVSMSDIRITSEEDALAVGRQAGEQVGRALVYAVEVARGRGGHVPLGLVART